MNGGSSLAEVSASSASTNGRGEAIASAPQRADMDIQPPLTLRRCTLFWPLAHKGLAQRMITSSMPTWRT